MESILWGLLGALSTALGMCIGVYMSKSKSKAKEKDEIRQNKERRDICRLLNSRKDILVRSKNCETSAYYAHVVTHQDINEEYIIIDLD
jgi:predicted membrane protein